MSSDLTNLITTLFTAPTEAVVDASAEQRRIWIKWLKDVLRLINDTDDDASKDKIINEHLKLAPVWKLNAKISLGVTMRVSSIERTEAGASLGIGVGMLQASGSFSFMSESTSESVMQARAEYALSNENEVNLKDYMATLGIDLSKASEVENAIKKLGAASTVVDSGDAS